MNLNKPSKQITGFYTGFCMDEVYSGFANLTGHLVSGLPLNDYYKNIYNEFGEYAREMVDYNDIYFGKIGSQETGVVISQIYGAGGILNAIYNRDYIELYNQGASPVDLNGWSLQYASATGSNWFIHILNGIIPPKRYFLVTKSIGRTNASVLNNAIITGNLFLSSIEGKIALKSDINILEGTQPFSTGAQNIIDFIGYGLSTGTNAVSDYKGDGPAPRIPNSQLAIFRKLNGSYNTNNNSGDFYFAYPTPRSTGNYFEGVTLFNNSNNLNEIIINGAGLSTSNGTYSGSGIFSGKFKYIKNNQNQQIFWSGNKWVLTNNQDPLGNPYAYYSNNDTRYPWQGSWSIYTDESFEYFNDKYLNYLPVPTFSPTNFIDFTVNSGKGFYNLIVEKTGITTGLFIAGRINTLSPIFSPCINHNIPSLIRYSGISNFNT